MNLAELTYGTEEGGNKRRKSRSTCSFCIRFTLVALLIILLTAATTATVFFLLGSGETDHGECIDSVTTTQSPIPTPTTTTTTTARPTRTTTTTTSPSTTTTPPLTTTTTKKTTPTTSTTPTTTTTKTNTTPPKPPTTTNTTPSITTTPPPPKTTTTTTPPTKTTTTIPSTTTTPPTTTITKKTTTAPPPPPIYTVIISVNNGEWYCGGSLIKKNRVLTARQCCVIGANMYTIFLGGNDEPSRQIGTSTKSLSHDIEDPPTSLDDGICIIHLDAPVSCEGVTTIRMPSRSQCSESFERYNATFSGWERTSNDDTFNTHLMHTNVIIKENTFCKRVYPKASTERNLCTYDTNGFGICNGHVGDPLTITESDGVETQIGIASFGPHTDLDGYCDPYDPNGFIRVTKYLFKIGLFAGLVFRP
ncbi:Hypothetical predicted protein [Cloeon dipterum]|uniref:Peptidase S1 domain-containing protein n=1 Tax=Cloeon dipterum TaxID=197152 RepID=A0A8S1CPP8_9INSE|nr:Hypothetical predicted protein [Cloeon dipterum]